jgi:hypothetical protein
MQKLREKLCCSKKSIVSDGGVTRVVWDSSDGALPSVVLTPWGGAFFSRGGVFSSDPSGGAKPPLGGAVVNPGFASKGFFSFVLSFRF